MDIINTLAHFIVPRASNDHKAKLLHSSSLLVLIVVFLMYQLAFSTLRSHAPQVLGYAANISTDEIIKLTNQKRAEAGLPPLTLNASLATAAKEKGEDMLAKGYWAHVAPDGTEPWKFFADVGYRYRFAGENLARDFSNSTAAVDAWMASPSHKENMLSPKYREIGVAVVEGSLAGADSTIIVQLFGSQLVDTLPQAPIAQAKAATTTKTIANSPTTVPEKQSITPTPFSVIAAANPSPVIESPTATHTGNSTISSPQVLISPFNTTKTVSLVTIVSLLGVVVIDWFVISKRRIRRLAGRSFAHAAFLGMLLVILLLAKAGNIL